MAESVQKISSIFDRFQPSNNKPRHMMQPQHLAARYVLLCCAEEGKSASDAARLLNINRSNAFRRFQTMQREGLVTCGIRSNIRFWQLTPAGIAVLQHVRKGFGDRNIADLISNPQEWGNSFRWHHLMFKFLRVGERELDEHGRLLASGLKAGFHGSIPGFWTTFNGGWRAFITGRSVLVFCPRDGVQAHSVYAAVQEGTESAISCLQLLLMLLPWLRVSERFELCRQHLASEGVFKEWVPPRFNYRSDRLIIDFSKGTAELEAVDSKFAFDDMMALLKHFEAVVDQARP